MWRFQIYVQSICVLVFLSYHFLFCPAADGLCSHPGHESNEKITFSNSFPNMTYPENTTATFFCEGSTKEYSFKVTTCTANGSWIFPDVSRNINCSLEPSNRCQRPDKQGVNPSLKSLIYNETCLSLHQGISNESLDNFMDDCDMGPFWSDKYNHATPELQEEIEEMCRAFPLPRDARGWTQKILLAVQPIKSDLTIWEKIKEKFKSFFSSAKDEDDPPNCYYLKCPYVRRHSSVVLEKCDAKQKYWICKHNISSCGIPSQPKHSTIDYYNIFVDGNATYKCQEGYVSNISLKRKCQNDGYWSKSPTCEPVDCGKPNVNENVTSELTQNKTTYRNWVMHKCRFPGQNISGSIYRMCQANKKWDGESPVCKAPPIQPEREAKNIEFTTTSSGLNSGETDLLKLVIGVIAGVTLFLIVLMWLSLAALLQRHKRNGRSIYRTTSNSNMEK